MRRSAHTMLGRVLAAVGVIAAVAMALLTGATAATGTAMASAADRPGVLPAHASAKAPCPSGYVCIYPGDDDAGNPTKYYRYRTYNLSNQYGTHLIVNNQTGGAKFRLCTGYNGVGCGPAYGPGAYYANLTPINSIILLP